MSERARLAAIVDGVALTDGEARELWKEFSAHMDANEGDLAGFARTKGWHGVSPEYRSGQAVLLVSTTPEASAANAKPKPAKKGGAKAGPGSKAAAPRGKGGARPKR